MCIYICVCIYIYIERERDIYIYLSLIGLLSSTSTVIIANIVITVNRFIIHRMSIPIYIYIYIYFLCQQRAVISRRRAISCRRLFINTLI